MKFYFLIGLLSVSLNCLSQQGLELKKTEPLIINYYSNLEKSDTAKLILNFQGNDTIKVFFLEPTKYSASNNKQISTLNDIANCNQYDVLFLSRIDGTYYITYPDFFLISNEVKMVKSIQKLNETSFELIPLEKLNFEKVNSWLLVNK